MISRFLTKYSAGTEIVVSGLRAVLAGAIIGLPLAVIATEPTTSIEIVTPEDLMRAGKFTTNQVEVVFREKEISGFKPLLILFHNGKQIDQLGIDLRPEHVDDQDQGSGQEYSSTRIEAVPVEFWKRVEPGVYAHKIRIEANLRDGAGSLIEEEWVRWRTDGQRVELLDIEHYSALVDKPEYSTDANGKPVAVLTGLDVKLENPGKATMEKPDARIGNDGVRAEQPVKLKIQELERSLDESNED